MGATKWLGLCGQERQGYYAGQVIKKADIPAYTRIVLRYNKYYENGSNRPRFIFCFADSEGYKERCIPLELVDDKEDDEERMYTTDEVYKVIHGMETYYGLPYGDNLIEDFI